MTTVKKYKVANPRGVPAGTRICRFREEQEWFEGDQFEKPAKMKKADVDHWIAMGILVEVDESQDD